MNIYKEIVYVIKTIDGGKGSGNFGHSGRPGKVGGSSDDPTAMSYVDNDVIKNPDNHSVGKYIKKNKDGKNKLVSERQKLHSDIEKEFLSGVKKKKNPVIYFNGGGSASGKGSIAKFIDGYPTLENRNGVIIDPDEIKRKFPEFDEFNPNSAGFTHEESSLLSKHLLNKAIKAGKYDVLMDGTLGGSAESVIRKIKKAKQSGMPVKANYVTVDMNEAAKRNYLRYLETGRFPPLKELYKTHVGVSNNFEDVYKEFDSGQLIDTNSGKPEVIAKFENGKLNVLDKEKYKNFIDKKNMTYEELRNNFMRNIEQYEKEFLEKNPGKKLRPRPEIE